MVLMKHRTITVLGPLLALFLVATWAHGAEFGARAYGMGGAYTGVAEDFTSLMYNPARLSDSTFEVGIGLGTNDLSAINTFNALLDDPSSFDENASLNLSSLSGLSLGRLAAGLAVDGTLNVDAACAEGLCASGEYMTQILLGMNRDVVGLPLGLFGTRIGATLKHLNGRRIEYINTQSAPTYETTMDEWIGKGYSLDLGAALQLSPFITLGVAASDIISTFSWDGTRTVAEYDSLTDDKLSSEKMSLGSEDEDISAVYRFGVAFRPPVLGATLALDVASDNSIRYGVEKRLLANAITVRAGQIRSEGETTTTAGLGFALGPARIDTAFGSSDGFKNVTSMVEASVRF